jgi:hypothetical protein
MKSVISKKEKRKKMPSLTISSSSPAKSFESQMYDSTNGICIKANSFGELKKLFHSSGAHTTITQQLLHLPLVSNNNNDGNDQQLSETSTVLSCCHPDVERVRKLIARFSDVKILIMSAVADEVQKMIDDKEGTANNNNATNKNENEGESSGPRRRQRISDSVPPQKLSKNNNNQYSETKIVTFFANVIGLLYGLVFPAGTSQPVACASLVEEKNIIEKSEHYASANAAERRKAMQNSVLCVFSDRGQRFYFSKLWTNVLQEVLGYRISSSRQNNNNSNSSFATSMHILSLHLLTDVNNSIIPWLTNPLLLSESLTEAYSDGGLLAVLALEGLLALMISHGLEYPKFYTGLYALVAPDIFSSPHRNRFFRLLHLALTSVRVSAAVAASFIKRLARCALMSPSPALYFVLPFIRQKLQQHKNCFALIHRSLRDVDEEEAEVEKQKKKMTFSSSSGNENTKKSKDELQLQRQIERVERLKKLFEGVDCFDPKQPDPEKTNAVDSTLWEIAALEKHSLPAVRNAVAAFASPAEDNQNLQFERSYARLFAHSMSMTETASAACTVVPPPKLKTSSSSAAVPQTKNSAGFVRTEEDELFDLRNNGDDDEEEETGNKFFNF